MTRTILLIVLVELVPVVLIALILKILARRKERHTALIDAGASQRGSPPER